MKKQFTSLLALGLILTGCGQTQTGPKELSEVQVGVIQFVQHPALDKSYEGFKDTLLEAGVKEENINFQNAGGDASNCQTIAETLVNEQNDLIYAIATSALQAAANKTTDIPIVGAAVTNFQNAGVVQSNEKPDTNVTGASDLNPVKEQLELLKQLVPNAKKIAIYYCNNEANSVYQGELAQEAAKTLGLEANVETVSESNEIQATAQALVGKYDAVYIPTDNLLAENMATATQVFNENKLPCIVGESGMCENGGLATLSLDYYSVGQSAGKQALSILKGESQPQDMPISTIPANDCKYYINQKVAKQLNLTIPEDLLAKSTIIE